MLKKAKGRRKQEEGNKLPEGRAVEPPVSNVHSEVPVPEDHLGRYRLAYTIPTDVTPKLIIEGVVASGVPPLVINNSAVACRNLDYLNRIIRQEGAESIPADYVTGSVKVAAPKDPGDVEVDIL